jgi:ribonuclease HI
MMVYADGSCLGNPGPGGWAFLVLPDNSRTPNFTKNGGVAHTTNNRMELMATIEALKYLIEQKVDEEVILRTDSQYVKNGITTWINSWKKNNWKTADKKDVKNKELWELLDELNSNIFVKWEWVKGHSSDVFNNAVDVLAKTGIDNIR